MKILVIGNIASGKSTLSNSILGLYPEFCSISIDEMRKLHSDGSELGEKYAKQVFIDCISSDETCQIIEFSGIGELAALTFEKIKSDSNILIIYLRVPEEIINLRLQNRCWDTPFPLPLENLPTAIKHTSSEFSRGVIESHLKMCPQSVLLSLKNETNADIQVITELCRLYIQNIMSDNL
ncbi:hypothetical protein Q4489_18035 [Thalassotalea sp. 1_MG-2023]|uniref:hypothetical protein n=1 Tax=Thalassotalea sp. 1_MG-2023 TaxID=3062680 RepID=UPI0026E31918|nr:hypothetical protein [Thalassotalea sp. 1_MG-2023]MDO6428903.1 hypothetical protein [Thalassotalea sp. 1_MG-2023]